MCEYLANVTHFQQILLFPDLKSTGFVGKNVLELCMHIILASRCCMYMQL